MTIEASTDWAGSNTATGIKAAEGAVIAVHSAGAMDISAEIGGTTTGETKILEGANGILANGDTMYYLASQIMPLSLSAVVSMQVTMRQTLKVG